jgi:hypothetical protein
MSWDVVVFNFNGSPPSAMADLPDDYQFALLGSACSVREAISEYLPGVDWSDPTWGAYIGEGFSIEFPVDETDSIKHLMLHVRGSGDPISALLRFANANKWSLLDCSTGELLDPKNPSQKSWEGFQAFRDKVFGKRDNETDT